MPASRGQHHFDRRLAFQRELNRLGVEPVRLVGSVVRHTGSGWAIAFATANEALRDLVG